MHAIHEIGSRSTSSRRSAVAITFLSVLLGGCAASMVIEAEGDPAVSFDSFETYAWSPNQRDPGDIRVTPTLRAQIGDDINRILADMGYVRVETDPDFTVTYQVTIQGETITQTLDYYTGSNWKQTLDGPSTRRYEEGMLLIDIADGESDRLVWRGTATTEVDQRPNMEVRSARVAEAVRLVLAEFPSR